MPRYRSPFPYFSPDSTMNQHREGSLGRRGTQTNVNEARASYLDVSDAVNADELSGECGGEIAWIHCERLGKLERNTRCPVAVVTILGSLNNDIGSGQRGYCFSLGNTQSGGYGKNALE